MANQGQMQIPRTFYGFWPQNEDQAENEDLDYCCEVDDGDFFYAKTDHRVADDDENDMCPKLDPTDPLAYFLETGELTPNEYDTWRITQETVPTTTPGINSTHHQTSRLDFGPGYNSDSDSDTDDEHLARPAKVSYSYGHGYIIQIRVALAHESWNPTPDPTQDRRYTKVADDGKYKLTRFTQWSSSRPLGRNCRKMLPELGTSFKLKIEWERFINSWSHTHTHHTRTLQDFWSENAFQIYEALQELKDEQARVRATPNSQWIRSLIPSIPDAPEYHTTPFETLENTFETIGRMSRCIAEDFNAASVVEYVEEFIKALYREIEFNALVEEYEYRIGDAELEKMVKEYEAEKLRKAAEKSVMSRLTTNDEFDFIVECDDQSRLPWCCGDD